MEENIHLQWSTLEYEDKKKSIDWFWAVGIAVVVGGVLAIIYKNILFAVFLLLAGVLIFLYSIRTPDEIEVAISETGIRVDDHLYPYRNIESFWIDDDGERMQLILRLKREIMPITVIPVADVSFDDLSDVLLEYIPVEEMDEPLSHRIMDWLGF